MKIGVLLPTFREGADDALAFAREAADAGVDGVFAYDHLWPMGSPTRPSLAPFAVLAAVARRHERLTVGPLVARIGVVGNEHLVEQFRTLEALAPGRVIAALGTGDKLSMEENLAYGVPVRDAAQRRAMMGEVALVLKSAMTVWIGGGGDATNQLAREVGAEINLWDAEPDRVAELAKTGPVNWAGPAPDDVAATLDGLAGAGATWAVFSPQISIGRLQEWRATHELSKFH